MNNPTNVGTGVQTFTAPDGTRLNRNTQYFVHITFSGSGTRPRWNLTANDNEDSGKAIGWSIGNHRYTRQSGGTGSWQGGGGAYSTSIQIRVKGNTLAPAAPNLSAAPDETEVALTWDDPANNTITKYQYRRKTGVGDYGNWTDIGGSGASTDSYTVTGLTSGTTYTFAVRAKNVGGNGAAATVTAATLPAAPTNLLPVPGDRAVTLSWSNPGGDTITSHEVSTDGGTTFSDIPNSAHGQTNATGYTVPGLTNGTEYTFKLRARNNSGPGRASTATATPRAPPAAPTGLSATAGDGQVTLSWTNPGDNTIRKYQYSTDGGGTFNHMNGSSYTTTTHIVTGLSNGTAYTLALRAVNAIGEGPASTANARPLWGAPANLSATLGDRQVTLTWTDPNDSTITNYQVSTDGGATFTDISGSGADTTTTTVTHLSGAPATRLSNGTTYTLELRAANASAHGAAASATARPLWPAPTNLAADPGNGQAILQWDTGDASITDYRVHWQATNSGATPEISDVTAGSGLTTTTTISPLTNGTEYTFTVQAVDKSGSTAVITGLPSSATATPAPVPDGPANLLATARSQEVGLTWDGSADSTITKYQVSTGSGTNFADIEGSSAATTATTVTSLSNGTAYTLAVRAVNDSGKGPWSDNVTATPIAKPDAPVNFKATRGSNGGEVALTWDDPNNDTITGYQYRQKRGSGAFGDWVDIGGSDKDTLTHTVTGLSNGREYTFELRAVNSAGEGDASSDKAKPLWPAPTNLVATPDHARVHLEWDRNPGIARYRVDPEETSTGASAGSFVVSAGSGSKVRTVVGVPGNYLENGTEYTFTVLAITQSLDISLPAEVNETPVVQDPPAAPTNLSATPGDRQVRLKWDNPKDFKITEYEVSTDYNTTDGSGTFTYISSSHENTTAHTVTRLSDDPATPLTNGTTYTFAVRAMNGTGPGAASTVDAMPIAIPDAPTISSATPGDGQVALVWADPGDTSITKYQVRRKVRNSADSTYTVWTDIAVTDPNAPPTGYTVTGLTNGTRYTFAVRAVNGTGNGLVATVNARPIAVPAAPTALSATAGATEVALTWDDPDDDTITGYQVSTDGGETFADIDDTDISENDTDNTLAYTVTGLTNGTEYTFAVRAVNDPGNGPASTVTARPIAPPAAPEISSVGPGYRKVTLAWTDPNDSTITGYQVSTDGGGKFGEISGSGAGTTTHTVTGLENGTEYTLAVRAMNDVGEGDASAANATPFNNPPTGKRGEVSTNDNESYRFTMKDFAYSDDEVDTLLHVKIASPPVDDEGNDRGTLSLNGAAITSDTLPRQVTPADLEAGNLLYTPPENAHGEPFATFEFKVSDGESDSVAYAMAINVVRVYSVRFGAAAYAVEEGGDPVRVTVTLSKQAAVALEIPITVTPRGRTVAADYTVTVTDPDVLDPATGTVTLKFEEMGDTTRSFTIEATEEAEQDDNFHDVSVALGFGTLPTDVAKGAPARATLTIVDAEGAVVRARFRRLNDEILSKHALTDVTNRAISARMDDPCGKQAAGYTLAGGSTIAGALRSNAQALEDGTLTLDDVLTGSSFRLPLAAVNDDRTGGAGGLMLWGRGDRRALESTDSAFAWDGTVLTGQLGIDGCLREDLLAGLALSRSIGEFDYTDGTGPAPAGGGYGSRMTSVHPYLGWLSPQGLTLWATVGYGRGEIEIEDAQVRDGDPDYPVRRSDTTLKTAAAGASGPLMTDESPDRGRHDDAHAQGRGVGCASRGRGQRRPDRESDSERQPPAAGAGGQP